MKVFVTGGTGFIGTRVVRRLAGTGHALRCLVREGSDRRAIDEVGAAAVPGDLTGKQSLLAGMAGCDALVNVAAFFDFWVPDRRTYERINVDGTRNVMEAALETGVAKVVHVSTAAVWGNAAWPITEQSELGAECASEYARTKRAGDRVAWELHATRGLPLVVVYPSAVIGPDDPKAAGRYVRQMARGQLPAQILVDRCFSFVDVADVAEAIARALEKPGNIGEKYLVSAENLTWGQINRMICEISGARLPGLTFPDWLTEFNARVLTALANLTKRPPLLDMALDQVQMMRQGFACDGSRAARELGFDYTPIRTALQGAVASVSG